MAPTAHRGGSWLNSWRAALLVALVTSLLGAAASIAVLLSRSPSDAGLAPIRKLVLTEALASRAVVNDLAVALAALLLLHVLCAVVMWVVAAGFLRVSDAPRMRAVPATAATVGLAAVWVWVANAVWFPRSAVAFDAGWLSRDLIGFTSLFDLFTGTLIGAVAWMVVRVVAREWAHAWVRRFVLYGILLVAIAFALAIRTMSAPAPEIQLARPNVIVIGIDSLRPDIVGIGRPSGFTPNIDRFMAQAHRAIDAVTPLARTFPSWTALLTGRSPVSIGVRENLFFADGRSLGPTLPRSLRAAGWRTIYATDEVRFSVIDETFGFDEVISPPPGAQDYALTILNDQPLVNVFVNTPVGAWLFPHSHANRAAAATYRPEVFLNRLDSRLAGQGPCFLAVHLTLAHWPFYWAGATHSVYADEQNLPYPYLEAVLEVDRQFGRLMVLLERRGLLRNSLVIVISDHGEGLGLPSDNAVRGASQAVGRVPVNTWGHGSSVLSPMQYAVLLGVRMPPGSADDMTGGLLISPLTLEDVSPTVLDLLGLPPSPTDGVSFAGALRGRSDDVPDRVRFTETGLMAGMAAGGQVDPKRLLDLAATFFRVDKPTGRVLFRSEALPGLLAAKERAAFNSTGLLAAIPTREGVRYIFVPREGGLPRSLATRPSEETAPEEAALWDALQARYRSELPSMAVTAR